MKRHTLALMFLGLCTLSQAKEKVIEQPPFIAANTKILEIDKIVLSDTATTFYMKAYFRPNNWISLNENSFLIADNGQRYDIKSTEGMTLGEKFWMPESGEADFKMHFPSLPASVKSVDFSEGEGERFWSIWGISLTGKLPKLEIPKELAKQKLDNDTPLPTLGIKKGKTVFSGKMLEYKPEMKLTLKYSYRDLLSDEYIQGDIGVNSEGLFCKEFDLIVPTFVNLRLGEVGISVLLVPGEALSTVYNSREIFRKASKIRKHEKSYGKSLYFSGYLTAFNQEISDNEFIPTISVKQLMADVNGMDLEQYKEYVMKKYRQMRDSIERASFSANYKNVLKTNLDLSVIQCLIMGDIHLKQNYIIKNNLKDEAASAYMRNTKIEYPNNYFDGLKDLNGFKSPFIYYSPEFDYSLMMLQRVASIGLFAESVYSDLVNKQVDELMQVRKMATQINGFSPLTEEQFKELSSLSNPVYLQEITDRNNILLAKLEANKKKTGYKVNEAGEVANEDLFYSIISTFKGKVLLVDMWATWCGPCRMAMKDMLPMKETLADKEIVYIYITGETSPLETWKNMIPDIHGEHFRVTNNQWEFLYKDLKIGGVPTYFIIDREGNIVHKTTGFPGVDTMKKELLKVLDK